MALYLLSEPQMIELTKIFIPKIKTHWRDLAYAMRYDIANTDGFYKDGRNLAECCEKLLINWLETDHGPTPKTYQTLLEHIKQIDDLTAASEEIKEKLIKGKEK